MRDGEARYGGGHLMVAIRFLDAHRDMEHQ
jgi:hypothetical protein